MSGELSLAEQYRIEQKERAKKYLAIENQLSVAFLSKYKNSDFVLITTNKKVREARDRMINPQYIDNKLL